MRDTVFFELEFFLLVASSLVVPIGIYAYLFWKQAISRKSVLAFATILIALSGADVWLLQSLAESAKASLSHLDDKLFASGVSIALYILPAVFAGIAVNLISHLLNRHLDEAEQKFEQQATRRPLKLNFHILRVEKHKQPGDKA